MRISHMGFLGLAITTIIWQVGCQAATGPRGDAVVAVADSTKPYEVEIRFPAVDFGASSTSTFHFSDVPGGIYSLQLLVAPPHPTATRGIPSSVRYRLVESKDRVLSEDSGRIDRDWELHESPDTGNIELNKRSQGGEPVFFTLKQHEAYTLTIEVVTGEGSTVTHSLAVPQLVGRPRPRMAI